MEAAREAVRRALAAGDAERFADRLAEAGIDEATLAACLAALEEFDAEASEVEIRPANGVLATRTGPPRWRRRLVATWRDVRPQLIDMAWKVGAALAAAAAAGALGLGG